MDERYTHPHGPLTESAFVSGPPFQFSILYSKYNIEINCQFLMQLNEFSIFDYKQN